MEKEIDCRYLRSDEFEKFESLSSFCFQYERTAFEEAKDFATYETIRKLGVFDKKENLLSKVAIHSMSVHIGDKSIKMGGISNVATWPEHRNKGYVNKLMNMAIETLKDENVSISFLLPFSTPFYRKYGYETVVFHKKMRPTFDNIKNLKTNYGKIEKVDAQDERPKEVYNNYTKNKCLMLSRSDFWWRYRVYQEKSLTYVYFNELNIPEGYISLTINNHHLEIHDIVSLNNFAYLSLMSLVNHFQSMAKTIEFKRTSIDDPLPYFAEEPKFEQVITPYYAAKIISFDKFVSEYPFLPSVSDFCFTIEIVDNSSKWNNGVYSVVIAKSGLAQVEKLTNKKADVVMSIQDVTRLILGGVHYSVFNSVGDGVDTIAGIYERTRKEVRFFPEFF